MAKLMLFIDGTWLYQNNARLAEAYGKPGYQVDFGKLPQVLASEIGDRLGKTEVDVVRTYLFGSYPANCDPRDEDAVERQIEFFDLLKEEYHYEVETFPINFLGRRLRRGDRDVADTFVPKEKCVDISLATTMLYFAAIPYAYDIAIGVLGDQDFKPVLQHVRRLGKRVAIASIKGSCSPDLSDARDNARVKDFDVIWFDDLLHKLELKYEPHMLQCESPAHHGDRKVWTTFHPRKSQRFYCDDCRAAHSKQKLEAKQQLVSSVMEPTTTSTDTPSLETDVVVMGTLITGTLKKKVGERGFGFVRASHDGKDYFFHLTDLAPGTDFEALIEGMTLVGDLEKLPSSDKAGSLRNVRAH